MYSHLTNAELLRLLLSRNDLSPLEVILLERIDNLLDEVARLENEIKDYEHGHNPRR